MTVVLSVSGICGDIEIRNYVQGEYQAALNSGLDENMLSAILGQAIGNGFSKEDVNSILKGLTFLKTRNLDYSSYLLNKLKEAYVKNISPEQFILVFSKMQENIAVVQNVKNVLDGRQEELTTKEQNQMLSILALGISQRELLAFVHQYERFLAPELFQALEHKALLRQTGLSEKWIEEIIRVGLEKKRIGDEWVSLSTIVKYARKRNIDDDDIAQCIIDAMLEDKPLKSILEKLGFTSRSLTKTP
ncbi:hypothetical protein QUF70_02940 [Desulfobacterales bacterium HSG17]|nr:hypothetical protein [Desulfobacterales bacterium HSG17]